MLIVYSIQRITFSKVKTNIYIEITSKIYSNPIYINGNTYVFLLMSLNSEITFLDLMEVIKVRLNSQILNYPHYIPNKTIRKYIQCTLKFQIKVHYLRGKFGILNQHQVGLEASQAFFMWSLIKQLNLFYNIQ